MKIDLKNILFYIGLPIVLGFTVTMLIGENINYFNEIRLPLNVPKWLFMVVWTILYVLSGISAYIIDDIGEKNKLFYINLALNLLWLPIFFVLRNNVISVLYTILMTFSIFINVIKYYNKNKLSGILLIPYFIWMLFGSYLTIGILILN